MDQRQNRCRHADFPLTPSLPADVRETAGDFVEHVRDACCAWLTEVRMWEIFDFFGYGFLTFGQQALYYNENETKTEQKKQA